MLKGRLEVTLAVSQYRNESEVENYIMKALEGKNNSLTSKSCKEILTMLRENSVVNTKAVTISTYDYDLSHCELITANFMNENMLEQVLLTDSLFEEFIDIYSEKDLFDLYKDMIRFGYCPKDIIKSRDNCVAFKENISIMFEAAVCSVKSIMNRIDSTNELEMTTFTIALLDFIQENVAPEKMYIVDDIINRLSLTKTENTHKTVPVFALDALCSVIYKRVNR